MSIAELIQHEDFLSANIYIKLRNLVSETVVDSNVKTIGSMSVGRTSESNHIQFLEILPKGMALSVPKYTCAVGHSLELDLHVTRLSKYPFDVRLLGRVTEVEKTSEDQERIAIALKAVSDVGWKNFCQLFSKRQGAIRDFFNNARGY